MAEHNDESDSMRHGILDAPEGAIIPRWIAFFLAAYRATPV
jgi:hypothetical protein